MASHLTTEERDRIVQLRHRGANQKEIARALTRSPATISRELRRGPHAGRLLRRPGPTTGRAPPSPAAHHPQNGPPRDRGNGPPRQPPITGPRNKSRARLKRDDPGGQPHVSARTIYAWIARDEHRAHWMSLLRRRGKRPVRRKKPGGIGMPAAARHEREYERSDPSVFSQGDRLSRRHTLRGARGGKSTGATARARASVTELPARFSS